MEPAVPAAAEAWQHAEEGACAPPAAGLPAAVPSLVSTEGEPRTALEVVASTEAFRVLARRRLHPGDRVLEIGCCRGQCTVLLAERAAEVLALDVAKDCTDATLSLLRKTAPRLRAEVCVEQLDMLEHIAWLRSLGSREPALNVVFVDIGGNRMLPHVLRLLQHLQAAMPQVRYTAVKSEALAALLKEAPEGPPEARAAWWATTLAGDHSCKKRPLRPMEVIMAYPVRLAPDGREICRFANYGFCRKGDDCAFAHGHCHCCGQPGHLARACPLLQSEQDAADDGGETAPGCAD